MLVVLPLISMQNFKSIHLITEVNTFNYSCFCKYTKVSLSIFTQNFLLRMNILQRIYRGYYRRFLMMRLCQQIVYKQYKDFKEGKESLGGEQRPVKDLLALDAKNPV